jgi:scyllo-inositol 2-dehydrogenase (NADP+)
MLTMTFEAPVSEWHLVVVAERRTVMMDLFRDVCVVLGPDGGHGARNILWTTVNAGVQHAVGVAATGARILRRRQDWGHDRLIGEVLRSIREGRPSPVPVEDALEVVRVTEDILAAID